MLKPEIGPASSNNAKKGKPRMKLSTEEAWARHDSRNRILFYTYLVQMFTCCCGQRGHGPPDQLLYTKKSGALELIHDVTNVMIASVLDEESRRTDAEIISLLEAEARSYGLSEGFDVFVRLAAEMVESVRR